jgi:hypothetical protein
VADAGHGNFAFSDDRAALSTFLNSEMHATANTTVTGAKVTLTLPPQMELVRATGAGAQVEGNQVTLRAGSLAGGEERRIFLELRSRGTAQATEALAINASWDLVRGEQQTATASPIAIRRISNLEAVYAGADPVLMARAAGIVASRTQVEAAEAFARGDVERAQGLIAQNQASLARALTTAPASMATAIAAQASAYRADANGYSAGGAAGQSAAKSAVAREQQFAKVSPTAFGSAWYGSAPKSAKPGSGTPGSGSGGKVL